MTLPKISIVVPSLNKVKYIGSTLNSIFTQKYPNLEVIIQDGASTDGSLEIIKQFARKHPHEIKWESKKDNGQLDAINKGLSKASSDILTYINADDIYEDDSFESVAKVYQENPRSLWFAGRGMVINKEGKEIAKYATSYKNYLLSQNSRLGLLVTNYLMQPSVFFTKTAFEKYGPLIGIKRGVMEYAFWLKLSEFAMPVVMNKTLSAFRMSGENISSLYFRETLMADNQIVKKFTKNPLIIGLHKLHNVGRMLISGFV